MKNIVHIPIEDTLDLHAFQASEVPSLLEDYFSECVRKQIFQVRIIHGKGSGMLKRRVHGLLSASQMVEAFADAPPEAGGWGATLVTLKSP
jgi:DNA-nicking Smr family endonuclease